MNKWKKTLRYTQCLKKVERELTWDLFVKGLSECMEFFFYYKDLTIDIAFHYENQERIYELNISDDKHLNCLLFKTVDELVSYKAFDNKSLFDIWEELEN